MEPKISPSFWSDPDLVNLPHDTQAWVRYSLLWMITNPDTNMCGIFRKAPRLYEFQTGLEAQWLERTLEAAPKMFVVDGEAVLLKNYVRYQFGWGSALTRNTNIVKALLKALARASQGLRKPFLLLYPELEPLYRAYQAPDLFGNTGVLPPSTAPETPPEIEGLPKGLPSPQKKSSTVQYQNSTEGCGEEPHLPSEEEVVAYGMGPVGIPPEYCRDYHRWRTNSRLWLNSRQQLILWQKDLLERWTAARATWRPKISKETAPAEDLEARLQTETDPAKRRALRARLKPA